MGASVELRPTFDFWEKVAGLLRRRKSISPDSVLRPAVAVRKQGFKSVESSGAGTGVLLQPTTHTCGWCVCRVVGGALRLTVAVSSATTQRRGQETAAAISRNDLSGICYSNISTVLSTSINGSSRNCQPDFLINETVSNARAKLYSHIAATRTRTGVPTVESCNLLTSCFYRSLFRLDRGF